MFWHFAQRIPQNSVQSTKAGAPKYWDAGTRHGEKNKQEMGEKSGEKRRFCAERLAFPV